MPDIRRTPAIKINRDIWLELEKMRQEALRSSDEVLSVVALSKEGWSSYVMKVGLEQIFTQ